VDYLVMECVEGETLAKRLEKGALPLEQVLKFSAQVADALDKAHRSGVVHRDLKPSNIMLTKSGVKLLDFGLAKPVSEMFASGQTLSISPTTMRPLTAEGAIVGTVQYMSPEQLEGKEPDARSDLFSFGAVLYEMVTGNHAFDGKSQASVIAAILEHEPQPISAFQPMAPPALDRLIRTCLAKDPEERIQTAHDVKLQLQWIAEGDSQTGPPVGIPRRSQYLGQRVSKPVANFAFVASDRRRRRLVGSPPPNPRLRCTFTAPCRSPRMTWHSHPMGAPWRWSPIRTKQISTSSGHTRWEAEGRLQCPEQKGPLIPSGRPMAGPSGSFANGKLKKADLSGGLVQVLGDAPNGRGGTWNAEGTILFSPNVFTGIYRLSSSGGTPIEITKLDASRFESSHRWPVFSPGRAALPFPGRQLFRTLRKKMGFFWGR